MPQSWEAMLRATRSQMATQMLTVMQTQTNWATPREMPREMAAQRVSDGPVVHLSHDH